jgi:hypothetical protein
VSADQRVELARDYLRGARQRDINYMRPSRMLAELAETRRQLGRVLTAAAELEDAAGRLAEIRGMLAAFDWEFADRQLALEQIERIVAGGEQ